jgi:RNA polymerase sigma-70 factor (ECF subfamily)
LNPVIDIKAIASGDVKAFEVLYLAYYNKVLTYTTSLLHNSVKAEDATQDVFLKIWRNRHNLKEGENVNSYIYLTARRVVLDIYRDEKYAQRHKEWTELNSEDEFVEASCVNEIEDIATKMIQSMPPKRKEIFMLSRKNGLTAKEIADKMDLSVNTVNKHIALALATLKKKLNDYLTIIILLLIIG